MKSLVVFLAGGVAAAVLIANMSGSFTPSLASQVAPIEVTTLGSQASPEASFEDRHSPEPSESAEPDETPEPNETEGPDDHGGNSGPSDNSGPGSDNSGSGSDSSGPGGG